MCTISDTLTWPENPADPMPPDPPKRARFGTLTFRSTVYVALPVPEHLPYSGYATGVNCVQR